MSILNLIPKFMLTELAISEEEKIHNIEAAKHDLDSYLTALTRDCETSENVGNTITMINRLFDAVRVLQDNKTSYQASGSLGSDIQLVGSVRPSKGVVKSRTFKLLPKNENDY